MLLLLFHATLICGALCDLKLRRAPNGLSCLALVLASLMQRKHDALTLATSMLVLLALAVLGAIGGGDLKMHAVMCLVDPLLSLVSLVAGLSACLVMSKVRRDSRPPVLAFTCPIFCLLHALSVV